MLSSEEIEAHKNNHFISDGLTKLSVNRSADPLYVRIMHIDALSYYGPEIVINKDDRFSYPSTVPLVSYIPSILTLEDSKAIGWRTVHSNGDIYSDELHGFGHIDECVRRGTIGHYEGFYAEETIDGYHVYTDRREDIHYPNDTYSICSLEHGNYGAFLLRVLPKLLHIRALGISPKRILMTDDSPWVDQFVRLLNFDSEIVKLNNRLGCPTFERLHIIGSLYNEGLLSGYTKKCIDSAFHDIKEKGLHRVYISRRRRNRQLPNYRPLLNEEEIESYLEQHHGFTPIVLEDLSVIEQISIFKGASVICGPSGSGMINAMFCKPGTRLLELESFSSCMRQHAKLYSSRGLHYSVVYGDIADNGKNSITSKWSVNIDSLKKGILRLGL